MRSSLLIAWVLRFVLAVAFFFYGYQHLFDPGYAAQFLIWGYPPGWHSVTGALEFIGAVLILIPATTLLGVGILGALLAAASITHLVHAEGAVIIIPLFLLGVVAILGWLRWSERV